jgi:hypothetical protein
MGLVTAGFESQMNNHNKQRVRSRGQCTGGSPQPPAFRPIIWAGTGTRPYSIVQPSPDLLHQRVPLRIVPL